MMKKLIKVGRIVNTHGLTGLLKIQSFTENIQDLFEYQNIVIKNNEYTITKLLPKTNNYALISLKDINSINQVEHLKNQYIYVDRQKFQKQNPNEYYYADLIGVNIMYQDSIIGKVVNVADYGAGDILEIHTDNKVIFHPFNPNFITKIDLENNVIIVENFLT